MYLHAEQHSELCGREVARLAQISRVEDAPNELECHLESWTQQSARSGAGINHVSCQPTKSPSLRDFLVGAAVLGCLADLQFAYHHV